MYLCDITKSTILHRNTTNVLKDVKLLFIYKIIGVSRKDDGSINLFLPIMIIRSV